MTQQNTSYQGNQFFLYLRSGLLFVMVLLVTIIIGSLMPIVALLRPTYSYPLAQIWVRIVLALTEIISGISYQVTGLENIPKDRAGVVLCKHQSAWETIALMLLLPPQSILLKKSLLFIPFWGTGILALKPIAINRDAPKDALKQLLKQGSQRIKEGLWVVVYPEGTRTAPGEVRKFGGGGSLLAQRNNAPILPIAHNAGTFWPRYSFLKYPGVIQVRIGPVIETEGRKSKEVNAEAEAWINHTMQEIEASK